MKNMAKDCPHLTAESGLIVFAKGGVIRSWSPPSSVICRSEPIFEFFVLIVPLIQWNVIDYRHIFTLYLRETSLSCRWCTDSPFIIKPLERIMCFLQLDRTCFSALRTCPEIVSMTRRSDTHSMARIYRDSRLDPPCTPHAESQCFRYTLEMSGWTLLLVENIDTQLTIILTTTHTQQSSSVIWADSLITQIIWNRLEATSQQQQMLKFRAAVCGNLVRCAKQIAETDMLSVAGNLRHITEENSQTSRSRFY